MRPPLSSSRTILTLRSPPRSAPVLSIGPVIAVTLLLAPLWANSQPLAQLPCNFLRRHVAGCWTDSTGEHCSRICGLSSHIPAQSKIPLSAHLAAKTSASKAFHCSLSATVSCRAWDTCAHSRPWASLATRQTSFRPVATTTPGGLPRLKRHPPGWTARRHRQRLSHSPVPVPRRSWPIVSTTSTPSHRHRKLVSCGRVFDKLEGTNTGARNHGHQTGVTYVHRSAQATVDAQRPSRSRA